MSEVAIKLEGISKKYTIGKEKDGSLRGTLASLFSKKAEKQEDFWALKDVSFEVKKGDVIGIIGRNGAGKSTLLKVLSQITKPTEGKIEINGRIASLLEVGTGFHPELTGRENIFLNGTILGMTRKEVQSKFDEIVAFSGIEKFIDTPVKHYSSGMYVRLAFAVAAHLEPEILIIDEVLAVGDAEFQKKCLGKMKDVAGEGRTVLFVSHNLAALKNICKSGVYLKNGVVSGVGTIDEVIQSYTKDNSAIYSKEIDAKKLIRERGAQKVVFSKFIFNADVYYSQSTLKLRIKLKKLDSNYNPEYVNLGFHILDENENQIYHISNLFIGKEKMKFTESGDYILKIDKLNLKSGLYSLWFWLETNSEEQDFINKGVLLEIQEGNKYNYSNSSIISGVVQPDFTFEIL